MRINGFEVRVNGNSGDTNGYIKLYHEQEYSIDLRSFTNLRCDAEVFVDGESIGTFRLDPYRTISIERPVSEACKFTFLAVDSEEGQGIASGVSRGDQGLIKVVFRPEKKRVRAVNPTTYREPTGYRSRGPGGQSVSKGFLEHSATMDSCEAGVTGLGESSSQSFHEVANLKIDESKIVTINLRLVMSTMPEPKYKAIKPMSNSIPKPI